MTRLYFVLSVAVTFVCLAVSLALYPRLADQIPIHWNIQGQVDGYGAKSWAAFLMPEVMEKFRRSAMGKSGWRNCNLRTTFEKIIKRAGLKKWPRLFHNLRSSRQTELEDQFPSHVVCAWMGNSEKVARKHYLQVTPEHIAKALCQSSTVHRGEGEAKPEAVAKQKPKQQSAAMDRMVTQIAEATPPDCGSVQASAAQCDTLHGQEADGEGFEPTVDLAAHAGFQDRCLKPLGHPSDA